MRKLYSDRRLRGNDSDPLFGELGVSLTRSQVNKLNVLARMGVASPEGEHTTLGEVVRLAIDAFADAQTAQPDFEDKLQKVEQEIIHHA